MPIELKMPALSPTMEEGTLAKWLVKEGDTIRSVDEGVVANILVAEGTDDVKVGTVIALIAEEGEDASAVAASTPDAPPAALAAPTAPQPAPAPVPSQLPSQSETGGGRIAASPLARRLAEQNGLDLARLTGSGPKGRIVKADIEAALASGAAAATASAVAPVALDTGEIPHQVSKLSNMRKTIARRLTEAKPGIPHIYLTVDIQIDALLDLRKQLNEALAPREIRLSVNDMLIKALAVALIGVPKCNVSFAGDRLIGYSRADIAVAVSIPNGLITPIVTGANEKSLSAISTEMKELADRARDGKLQPQEYQGGTASISNMGMFGIKQFDAVINPPQGMIMAIGAGEKRPHVIDDSLQIATIMSATGSFDHRAIDGADGARLMQAFKHLVENPLGMLA